jgi:16S rRNA (adenine(1408)-N(1))-methyltransferase
MADASRRVARRGPHNALFLAEGAERMASSILAARADLVTATFPWGSLLRGVLGLDPAALSGVAGVLCPGGRLEVLASVVPSDGIAGLDRLDEHAGPAISSAWRTAGLELTSIRPATPEEVAATRSSWARRLGADRPVWRLAGQRLR